MRIDPRRSYQTLIFDTLIGFLLQPRVYVPPPVPVVLVAQAAEPTVYTPEEEKARPECNCILGAQHFSPFKIPFKDASKFVGNSTPVIGGVIILEYNVWHVAVVTGFAEKGFSIVEWNYRKCEETRRIVGYNDPHIRGFYVP